MREYFHKYKPFLLFLGKFFLTYLVLTVIYQSYLKSFDEQRFEVDGFTHLVADQVDFVLSKANAPAVLEPHPLQPSIKILYNNKYVARIIEGCNALSVMILFVAFVIAFAGKFWHTLIYIVAGCLLIHILNVVRIALLSTALYNFPSQEHILHGVIFPLFIYSVVFILWIIWVNKFSKYASADAEK